MRKIKNPIKEPKKYSKIVLLCLFKRNSGDNYLRFQLKIMSKSTKAKNVNVSTKWIDPVLQGLAYWIGYKKELYSHHLLNEGAIVAEVASLINANKSNGEIVKCEQYYDQIDGIKDTKIRADISIVRDNKIHTVIEVKREEAGNVVIEKDILNLCL